MKKFSKITGEKISEEPKIEKKVTESDQIKHQIMGLMEQFLSIRTYGPIGRYWVAGKVKIVGQELFLEALINLLSDKSLKDQNKLLEGLKNDIKDWELLDSKINEIEDKKIQLESKQNLLIDKNRILNIYNKYKDDEELLLKMVDESCKKIKSVQVLEKRVLSAKSLANEIKGSTSLFEKIAEKFENRLNQINS